ncbi:MAG: ankyrin repeat domain-containing protein [Bacteroidota bacterium]
MNTQPLFAFLFALILYTPLGASIDHPFTGGSNPIHASPFIENNVNLSPPQEEPNPQKKAKSKQDASWLGEEVWFTLVAENNIEDVKYLLENHLVDIEATDLGGVTAFLIACDGKQLELAKYLLKKGADRYKTNGHGLNAFHISCMHGDIQFTEWLLDEGLNPHIPTGDGRTGFHIACMYGNKELASWILTTIGLSKDALDHKGNNALDLVKKHDHWSKKEMWEYLRSDLISLKTKDQREKKEIAEARPPLKKRKLSNLNINSQVPSSDIAKNAFAEEEEEKKAKDISLTTSHTNKPNNHTSSDPWINIFQYMLQGNHYQKEKKDEEAIKCYKMAITCYRQNKEKRAYILAQINNDLGVSYHRLEKYEAAGLCYNQALKIREELLDSLKLSDNEVVYKAMSRYVGETRNNMGVLYLERCQQQEAILLLKAALATEWQHDKQAIETQYWLAIAYQVEKLYQKSKNMYEKVLLRQTQTPFFDNAKIAGIKKCLKEVSKKALQGAEDT